MKSKIFSVPLLVNTCKVQEFINFKGRFMQLASRFYTTKNSMHTVMTALLNIPIQLAVSLPIKSEDMSDILANWPANQIV